MPGKLKLTTADIGALIEALSFQQTIGRPTVEALARELAQHLMTELRKIDGIHLWTTPDAATEVDGAWEYRLVIQKQPGARAGPVVIRIELPEGSSVIEASDGAAVEGDRVSLQSNLATDIEMRVLYTLPGDDAG